MHGEIERYVRIQNLEVDPAARPAGSRAWRTIPNCERVAVWEYTMLLAPNDETGAEEKRFIFHIRYIDGVRKGSRLTYLGNQFSVLGLSDSKRLVGLELTCVPEAAS